MMNDEMLRNIEYLREKADVSYEDAASLLEKFDGNVMRVLVELERQGRVYPQGQAYEQAGNAGNQAHRQQNCQGKAEDVKKKSSSYISHALKHRVVVESGKGENKKTIADLSAPYCAGAALLAPWVAVGSIGLMFALGYRVRMQKVENAPGPQDVETFVDQTVSNIKKAANSIQETVRTEINNYQDQKNDRHDDDDEGGEITIE